MISYSHLYKIENKKLIPCYLVYNKIFDINS